MTTVHRYTGSSRPWPKEPVTGEDLIELALQIENLLGAFYGKRTLVVAVKYGTALPVRLHFRGALYGDFDFAANTRTSHTTHRAGGSKHTVVGQCSGYRYRRLS